jgi:hypothetical protein
MLRRFAAVSAIAVSLCIPAQAAFAVQPIDRCPLKPHQCIQTTLPELQDDDQPPDPRYRGSGRIEKEQQR